MTAIGLNRPRGLCGRGWSVVALAFCLAAVALSFTVVSAGQGVTEWRWWLLVFPVGGCIAAVRLPVRNVLIGCAIVMTGWIFVSGFSVGFYFVPAFVGLVLAVGRTQ